MRQTSRLIVAAAGSLLIGMSFANAQTVTPSAQPPAHIHVSSGQTVKAGHALRHVIAIQQKYETQMKGKAPAKLSAATRHEIVQAEEQAIRKQGLTISQYSKVITAARTDPKVRKELIAAAGLSRK